MPDIHRLPMALYNSRWASTAFIPPITWSIKRLPCCLANVAVTAPGPISRKTGLSSSSRKTNASENLTVACTWRTQYAALVASSSFNQVPVTVERSEEHTSELQSLMRISYAVFCLKKKKNHIQDNKQNIDCNI